MVLFQAFTKLSCALMTLNSLPNDKFFNLVQIESNCRRQKKKYLKRLFLSLIGLKTLWENEKMLVTSIFSFSHIMFSKGFLLKVVKSWDYVVQS